MFRLEGNGDVGGVGRGVKSGSLQYTTAPEASLYCWEAGEKEKESARGTIGRGREKRGSCLVPFPIFPRALSIFPIIANFIGIPSRSLCGGESDHPIETVWMARKVFCSGCLESCNQK